MKTDETQRLLKVKKAMKKKKPLFVRKDTHKKARVPFKWRKPRGRHSPVRQKHCGRPKLVSIGFGSPKTVKHLHFSGLEKVMVNTKSDLEKIDQEKQGAVISGKLGNRKKIELIRYALDKKIMLFNFRDPKVFVEQLEQDFKERIKSKKKKLTEKEQKESEKKKKAEEKDKKEEQKKAEETENKEESEKKKKEAEKELKEKTLIKKQ